MSANRNRVENNMDFTGATGTITAMAGRGAARHLLIPVNALGGCVLSIFGDAVWISLHKKQVAASTPVSPSDYR
jgi:hypothetical protein